MPETETLRDVFIAELKDAYDAEKQLIKALRKMSKAATHPELASAFSAHLDETTEQVRILEEVFGMLDMRPKGKHCPGIAGIIEEGNEAIEEKEKSYLLDAALVGGGKRAEHYEIAAYTTLVSMARELGLNAAASRLQEILDQELATDKKLDALATMLLPLAMTAGRRESAGDDDADEARTPAKRSTPKKRTARKPAAR